MTARGLREQPERALMRSAGFPCRFTGCEHVIQVFNQRSMEALHAASALRTTHEIERHEYHHQSAPEVRPLPPYLRRTPKNEEKRS